MGLFSKKKKEDNLPRQDSGLLRQSSSAASKAGKECFKCHKKLKAGHYTKANNRYCCDKCCNNKSKKGETCEFC